MNLSHEIPHFAGITTVCGNIATEKAYQSACILVKDVLKITDVPVYRSGCSEFNDCNCSFFYGQDGHCGESAIILYNFSFHFTFNISHFTSRTLYVNLLVKTRKDLRDKFIVVQSTV